MKACEWISAETPPVNSREVLASDGEAWFIASFIADDWIDASTGESIDSWIVWWMELPEHPQEEDAA